MFSLTEKLKNSRRMKELNLNSEQFQGFPLSVNFLLNRLEQ